MISKRELEAIFALCDEAVSLADECESPIKESLINVYRLLDAILDAVEEIEAQSILLEVYQKRVALDQVVMEERTEYKRLYEESIADRDRWKARAELLESDLINANINLEIMTERAEALERAIQASIEICNSCVSDSCKTLCPSFKLVGHGCANWQFDQSRFTP